VRLDVCHAFFIERMTNSFFDVPFFATRGKLMNGKVFCDKRFFSADGKVFSPPTSQMQLVTTSRIQLLKNFVVHFFVYARQSYFLWIYPIAPPHTQISPHLEMLIFWYISSLV
jgi:hypothetical protein